VLCDPSFAGERAAIAQVIGGTFAGISLGTSRDDLLQALLASLVRRSAANHACLRALHKPGLNVYVMGGAGRLADAMHRAWQGTHRFVRLEGDSLAGLGELARRILEAP
jgi:sugar (pentulose or hexulose) kinase